MAEYREERVDKPKTKELVGRHPDGILFYNHDDPVTRPAFKNRLQELFPTFWVLMERRYFPADLGTQFGSTFYGFEESQQVIRQAALNSVADPKALARRLPLFELGINLRKGSHPQEGGKIVLVPGTNKIVTAFDFELTERMKENMYRRNNVGLTETLMYPLVNELSNRYQTDDIYWQGHIDLTLTGIEDRTEGPVYFMDEALQAEARQKGLLAPISGKIVPMDHTQVLKGACNIKYLRTGNTWNALITDKGVLGPILPYLERNNIRVVELGLDQMDRGGGPKCRSLDLRWRR